MSIVEKGRKVGSSISGYLRKLARSPAWTYLKRDERAWVGFAIVILVVGIAIFADFIAPHGINENVVQMTWDYSTTNSEFTDNADGWNNIVQGSATGGWENIDTNGTIYAATMDNDAIMDNAIWSQSLSFTDTREVKSAGVEFSWSVADNTGLSSLTLKAILEKPNGDEITLWEANPAAMSGFAAVKNDVRNHVIENYVTLTGTYKLKLEADMLGSGENVSIKARWDNASLKIQTLESPSRSPSSKFIFGTDSQGRDVFSRVVHGTRIALEIGLLLVALEAAIGVPLGLIAGYYGGKADELVMRAVDVALSFPGIVLAAAFIGFFGPGLRNLIIALSLTGWAAFARITRAQALAIKEQPYVESARAIGEKDRTIISKYILPNGISPLIVIATMTLPAAILLASALNFMGLGVQPPAPAWGAMLTGARFEILDGIWWTALFPGAAIMITVLGFNFLGDALRDALDPRLREYKYV